METMSRRTAIYLLRSGFKQNPAESGVLDFDVKITDPAGIMPAWQVIDGGFCYLTADNKLHILRGSLTENETGASAGRTRPPKPVVERDRR